MSAQRDELARKLLEALEGLDLLEEPDDFTAG